MNTTEARCDQCGRVYDVDAVDQAPVTEYPHTCDDCGGPVELVDVAADHSTGWPFT